MQRQNRSIYNTAVIFAYSKFKQRSTKEYQCFVFKKSSCIYMYNVLKSVLWAFFLQDCVLHPFVLETFKFIVNQTKVTILLQIKVSFPFILRALLLSSVCCTSYWFHYPDRHDILVNSPTSELRVKQALEHETHFPKVIFLHLSVILFTGGSTWAGTPPAGTLPHQVHPLPQAGTPPSPRQVHPHPPGRYTPTPRQVHPPLAGTPPGRYTPRSSAGWEIRATSGRYASYWNTFLFSSVY